MLDSADWQYPGDIEALLLEAAAQDDLSSESETRLSLARHWFKNCLQYHHQCKVLQRNPVHLPSRVVDIGSSDGTQQPFLYETRGEVGAYLCLSHRWGGSHVITTTLGTLAERKSGIPIDQMPKTFRDAIIMTRKLGLKYIWIDSLCIIQDQLSDWESEAQAMGRIYKNATLTLTAVMSTSADTGLFFSYDGRQNRPCYLGTVHRVKAGHDVASTVPVESLQKTHTLRIFAKLHRQPPKGRHNYRFRPSGPLDRRGWVLQEEVLSPRLLAFGADGIYWECTAMDAAEYIPTGLTSEIDTIRYGATFKRILSQSAFARAIPDNPPVSYAVIIDSWDSMVENFSGRDLTQESDTLIALQGIVEVMKEVTGDVFLAGLWKRHLLQQLMWHIDLGHIEIEWDRPSAAVNVKSPKHVILPPRLTGPHKRSIKVPTWSWASVKHQVTWRFTGLTRPLMRVLEIDLKNQGPGNFEGRLRVRGIMRAAVARAGNQTKR
jgi:hypothetical protein